MTDIVLLIVLLELDGPCEGVSAISDIVFNTSDQLVLCTLASRHLVIRHLAASTWHCKTNELKFRPYCIMNVLTAKVENDSDLKKIWMKISYCYKLIFFVETFLWTLLLVNLHCYITVGSKFKIDTINVWGVPSCRGDAGWIVRMLIYITMPNYKLFWSLDLGDIQLDIQGLITQKQTSLGTSF